jgi:Endonuclease/Exonuclease/phosphatase family
MFGATAIVLVALSLSPAGVSGAAPKDFVSVGSWNIRDFSQVSEADSFLSLSAFLIRLPPPLQKNTRNADEIAAIALVAQRFDVLFLQEVVDATVVPALVSVLNATYRNTDPADSAAADAWESFTSVKSGVGSAGERYSVVWRAAAVVPREGTPFELYPDPRGDFVRPPLCGQVAAFGNRAVAQRQPSAAINFTLCTIHAVFGSSITARRAEAQALPRVVDWAHNNALSPSDPVLVAGDFNLPPQDTGFDGLRAHADGFSPAIQEPQRTTLNDVSLYDNVWFPQGKFPALVSTSGSTYVFDNTIFQRSPHSIPRLAVSDHRPVAVALAVDALDGTFGNGAADFVSPSPAPSHESDRTALRFGSVLIDAQTANVLSVALLCLRYDVLAVQGLSDASTDGVLAALSSFGKVYGAQKRSADDSTANGGQGVVFIYDTATVQRDPAAGSSDTYRLAAAGAFDVSATGGGFPYCVSFQSATATKGNLTAIVCNVFVSPSANSGATAAAIGALTGLWSWARVSITTSFAGTAPLVVAGVFGDGGGDLSGTYSAQWTSFTAGQSVLLTGTGTTVDVVSKANSNALYSSNAPMDFTGSGVFSFDEVTYGGGGTLGAGPAEWGNSHARSLISSQRIVEWSMKDYGSSSNGLTTDCRLFLSEYVKGTGNSKALEIFNPTSVPIATTPYQIWRLSNGGAWSADASAFDLSVLGAIQPGKTAVLTNGNAPPTMLARADATSGTLSFTGNDAQALVCDGKLEKC